MIVGDYTRKTIPATANLNYGRVSLPLWTGVGLGTPESTPQDARLIAQLQILAGT